MRVAVGGGTGLVGRYVVSTLADSGHQPVVLARSRGLDLTTGTGLDVALLGVAAVIDVSNLTSSKRRESVAFFAAGTEHLLAAGDRAGVRRHVALSIVGIDRVDFGYYEDKRRQEDLVLAAPMSSIVLRATQFHEFVGQLLQRSRGPFAVVPRMLMQPIAASGSSPRAVKAPLVPDRQPALPSKNDSRDRQVRRDVAALLRRSARPAPGPAPVGAPMLGQIRASALIRA